MRTHGAQGILTSRIDAFVGRNYAIYICGGGDVEERFSTQESEMGLHDRQ